MIHLAASLLLAASPSLQARYDAARAIVESSRDPQAIRAARREIAAVEHEDGAPRRRDVRVMPLPATWARAHPEGAEDVVLSARLAAIGRSFDGTAAFWFHDLRTGRTGSWNADALVPAASTVKLAVLAAAIRADREDLRYDATQVGAWSSNLGANRIVESLGYERVAAAMRGLGMTHSTYPGPYRVGTGIGVVHTRVTTAHDLGRALFTLQAAARGRPSYLRRAPGRAALDILRHSLPYGDNHGLLRPWLPGVAVAEKNGWLSDVRITAAIVYRRRGPLIVVVAASRPGIRRFEARALGRDVLRAAAVLPVRRLDGRRRYLAAA